MKILYLAPESTIHLNMSGGAGTHMRGTISHLKKSSDVEVLIGGNLINPVRHEFSKEQSVKQRNKGIKELIKPIIPNFIKKFKQDIRRLRDNKKVTELALKKLDLNNLPDIIYERSGYGFNTGLVLSKKFNIPLVLESDVTILDLIRPSSSLIFNKLIFKRREKKKIDNADSIVVMSLPSIDLVKRIWRVKHNNIYFKGLGIDTEINKPSKKINVAEEYSLIGKKVIGYVGIFQDYQNIPIIFDVAEKFANNKEMAFLIIGTGKRIEEYKNDVEKRGLDNVIFTGIIDKDKIKNYYEIIDIGLITDNATHMYPVKFLEFINYEKPTLVPKYPVFKTFFKNDEIANDFQFEPGNSEDLKKKIEYLLEHPEKTKNDIQYSISKVRDEYTWEQCSRRLSAVLEKTLN